MAFVSRRKGENRSTTQLHAIPISGFVDVNGSGLTSQLQRMNKQIMDWRWRAFVARSDPAQLKTSILEWLIPRLEIGLLHANVTEKMCNAWLSTIIHTLCELSGMSTMKTINRKAFCLLAGLPDLWLRMQTMRTTEIMVI